LTELKTLSNGVRVILENIPYVRSIAFGIWVKNGSSDETAGEEGISHYIEHMLFKGTKSRSAKDIAEQMDEIGGQINAYTTKEYTVFHTRTLDTHFDKALTVMSDMFLNSSFESEDIKKELGIITEEIKMYEDDPEEHSSDMLQNAVWNGSALGHPILGYEKSIQTFSRQKIKAYFSKHYRTDNTVISAAGNFKPEEMLDMLEAAFGKWKSESADEKCKDDITYKPSFVYEKKDFEQLHINIAFPCEKRESPLKYPVITFNTLFGGGISSLLFQKLREENGLTYSVYSYDSAYDKTGIFVIYLSLQPQQLKKVFELIFEECEKLRKYGIDGELLRKTKMQLISSFIMGNESSLSRMTSNGGSVLLKGHCESSDDIIKKAEAVTTQDITHVINRIFDYSKMSISACGSLPKYDIKSLAEETIQKAMNI